MLSSYQADLLHSDGLCAVPSPLLPPSLWGPVSRAGPLTTRQGQFVEEGQLFTHAQLAALIAIFHWFSLYRLGLYWWCWFGSAAEKHEHMCLVIFYIFLMIFKSIK